MYSQKSIFILFTSIILILLSFSDIFGADKPTIYIKALVPAKGIDESMAIKISREIENAVIGTRRYDVMSQDQVRQLFNHAEFQQAMGCNSEECIRQIIRATQTDFIIYGTITKEEGEYAVSINLMNRKPGGNAIVINSATQFTRTFNLRALTLIANNVVKKLHGESVKDDEATIHGQDTGDVYGFVVTSHPNGARLLINNADRGLTPKRFQYPMGKFNAKLTCPGYTTQEFIIDLPKVREYNIIMKRQKYPLKIILSPDLVDGVELSEGGNILGTITGENTTINVDSGDHVFTFRKRGYDDKNLAITLFNPETYNISMKKSEFILSVKANTPSRIIIDGKSIGKTPFEKRLQYGSYKVMVESDGFLSEERTVALEKNINLTFNLIKCQFIPFRVSSKPEGAEVFFGGNKKQGVTPGTFQWPEGDIEVKVKYKGMSDTQNISLKRNTPMLVVYVDFDDIMNREKEKLAERERRLEDEKRKRQVWGDEKKWGWLSLSFFLVSGATIGSGAYLSKVYYDKKNDYNKMYKYYINLLV